MKWTRPLCGSAAMTQNDFKTREIIEPQEASPMKKLSVVGIDIAKQVFHLVGMDAHGTILVRKRLYRAQVMAFIAQLPPTLMGDASAFKNSRQFAAWLGLVPRQHATGGKERLLGISKRGDS